MSRIRNARGDDVEVVEASQPGHTVEDEARGGASGDRRDAVAAVVKVMQQRVEGAEVGGEEDHAFAQRERIIEVSPFALDQWVAGDGPNPIDARHKEQVGEVSGAGP